MTNEFKVYQIIIFVISIILILRTFLKVLSKQKTLRELLLACMIWGSFALFGLFPKLTEYIAKITGFELGINALLVIITLFLVFKTMQQSLKNDKLENSITRLVRNQALSDLRGYIQKNK